jgi:hypothetical protein
MKRLNIDDHRVKNKNLINFGMDFLMAEKSKVKNELKKFDNEFFEMFQRNPNRNEKEVMRIIYMYYKNLKQAIINKQSNNPASTSGNSSANTSLNSKNTSNTQGSNVHTNNFTHNRKAGSLNTMDTLIGNNNSIISSNTTNSNCTNNNSVYNFNNVYNQNDNQDAIIVNVNKEKRNLTNNSSSINPAVGLTNQVSNNKEKKNDNIHTKPTIETKENPNELLDFNNDERKNKPSQYPKDKKYSKSELTQMEREYEITKKEQEDLKQRLHNYQKEFYEIHHRRVKYYKDIIGVETEYQKYKENKTKLKDIQEIITIYKNKKN